MRLITEEQDGATLIRVAEGNADGRIYLTRHDGGNLAFAASYKPDDKFLAVDLKRNGINPFGLELVGKEGS